MGQYIFTPPALAYTLPFTFEALNTFIRKGKSLDGWFYCRKVGTTVTLSLVDSKPEAHVRVKLYDTVIATVSADGTVHISEEIDRFGSLATTYWVDKTLADNGFGRWVYRKDFHYDVAGQTFLPTPVTPSS